MNRVSFKTYLVFAISIFIAFILTILPLPEWAIWCRPEWVVMVMVYWAIMVPHRLNVGSAWCVGLLLDALNGAVLGEHALLLTLIVYVVSLFHRKLRALPLWQQTGFILLFVLLYQFGVYLIQGILGETPDSWLFYSASFTSALFWPWVYILLRDSRRKFQIA